MLTALVGLVVLTPLVAAVAQGGPEVIDQGVAGESVRLVSSKEDVRRAVFGLLGIAAILCAATALYWHKSGQDAKTRFALAHPRPQSANAPTALIPAFAGPSSSRPAGAPAAQPSPPVVRPGASVFGASAATATPVPPAKPVPAASVFDQPRTSPASSSDQGRNNGAPRSSRVEPTLSADEWWAAIATDGESASSARSG